MTGQEKKKEVGEKCARQEAGANEAAECGKRDWGRLLILNAHAPPPPESYKPSTGAAALQTSGTLPLAACGAALCACSVCSRWAGRSTDAACTTDEAAPSQMFRCSTMRMRVIASATRSGPS